jgi:hypothetical protein
VDVDEPRHDETPAPVDRLVSRPSKFPADERDGIADYKFIRQLGAGSHGVFYLAYPPKRLPVEFNVKVVKAPPPPVKNPAQSPHAHN